MVRRVKCGVHTLQPGGYRWNSALRTATDMMTAGSRRLCWSSGGFGVVDTTGIEIWRGADRRLPWGLERVNWLGGEKVAGRTQYTGVTWVCRRTAIVARGTIDVLCKALFSSCWKSFFFSILYSILTYETMVLNNTKIHYNWKRIVGMSVLCPGNRVRDGG